jgi:tetratricopeptide (TPR) repeat protein
MRIENDEALENYFTIEAIMQRLGRDVNLYKNFFLSKDDFVLVQLRDRIKILIAEFQFATAAMLVDELEKIKRVANNSVTRQFIAMIRAILFAVTHNEPKPEFPIMLIDALRITCPQFDECEIERYHLTFNEISIISQYAGYFGNTNDLDRSIDIYNRLRRNINGKYIDEVEKARTYSSVLFNHSSTVGRANRYSEAVEVLAEGESFERNRGRLIELPSFVFNRGYSLLLNSNKEECLPYFALAYYGASIFANCGQEYFLPTIQSTVRENLGIDFD